jgi:hypothetical protein
LLGETALATPLKRRGESAEKMRRKLRIQESNELKGLNYGLYNSTYPYWRHCLMSDKRERKTYEVVKYMFL